jgi:fused signal recognition particle receptor
MPSLWSRLRAGLSRTTSNLTDRLTTLFSNNTVTPETLDELEEILIGADVGVEATQRILDSLEEARSGGESAVDKIRSVMREMLVRSSAALNVAEQGPTVVLIIGVNGVGKTTTIGKIAARATKDGKTVLIGAADTFRAAADSQLAVWADRSNAQLVRHKHGSDAAAVAYETVQRAISENTDLVLIDTAGRLHTKKNLMEELRKVKRVIGKHDPAFPHETLLVIDATSGQNALQQAKVFNEIVEITGIALTKLDSTARGGIVLAVAEELGVPVKYVGVGEGIEDLQEFDPDLFLDALFGVEREDE